MFAELRRRRRLAVPGQVFGEANSASRRGCSAAAPPCPRRPVAWANAEIYPLPQDVDRGVRGAAPARYQVLAAETGIKRLQRLWNYEAGQGHAHLAGRGAAMLANPLRAPSRRRHGVAGLIVQLLPASVRSMLRVVRRNSASPGVCSSCLRARLTVGADISAGGRRRRIDPPAIQWKIIRRWKVDPFMVAAAIVG